jgi:ankyrin repeat protein
MSIAAITSFAPLLVNPEPITIKGIKTFNPALFWIYTNKKEKKLEFVAVKEKQAGTSLGAIFKKKLQLETDKEWMGKVGNPRGILRNDPSSVQTRSRRELNVDTIREKLAYDLFQELGRGIFQVPKARLSLQPIRDKFNKFHFLANILVADGITESLRIMSCYMKGYMDLAKASTLSSNQSIELMKYLEIHHRPPESILTPAHTLVPLRGLMGLLAVGRCLADVDLLGGGGLNAGFVWVHDNQNTIIEARAVKIDPGYAFFFTHDDPKNACENMVINTDKKLGNFLYYLKDLKDLQTSTSNHNTIVYWESLTIPQKEEFLGTLLNSARYLQSEAVLDLLFYREGKFSVSKDADMPKTLAEEMQRDMKKWVTWQFDIYDKPLADFKQKHPEQVLRIKCIDQFGELPLPMSKESYPIRELFTDLILVKAGQEQTIDPTLPERDSLRQAWDSTERAKTHIPLERLFEENAKKIMILGRAGTGKSTLCQKIAHDWASGRLFNALFEAVYWLPLRNLNSFPNLEKPLDEFLSHAIASSLLDDPSLSCSVLKQIQQGRKHTLLILDGFDEATPEVRNAIQPLFNDPELHVLLSSRPGPSDLPFTKIDRTIENIGFSDQQIKLYSEQFFARNDSTKKSDLFVKTLKKDLNLFQLAHTPLQLQMLCAIWERNPTKSKIAGTLTSLYEIIVQEMLAWQFSRLGKNLQTDSSKTKKLLCCLGRVAAFGLESGILIIPESTMVKALENSGHTTQDLLETGLIKVTDQDPLKSYSFIHLTFQEYLAAYQLSDLGHKEQHSFLIDHKKNPAYRLTISFLCGIIYRQKPENIKLFFDALEVRGDNLELAFGCLNECENYLGTVPSIERLLSEKPEILHQKLMIRDESQSKHIGEFLPLSIYLSAQDQIHSLKWLLHKKPELLDQIDEYGSTVFMRAAFNGNIELMEFLYNQRDGSSLIQKFLKNDSASHVAANRSIEAMQWLYDKDPSFIDKVCNDGRTPFHFAAVNGSIEAMQWLYGKDPTFINKVRNDGAISFHFAAANGKIEAMQWLYDKDRTFIDKVCNDGATPFHFAAANGSIEAMQWLYDKDRTFIDKVCNDGATPFHDAAVNGKIEAMQWLYDKDRTFINKVYNDGRTPFHDAAVNGKIEAMQWLYDKSPTFINKVCNDGATPFHFAAASGKIEAMQWLYDKSPTFINKVCNNGATPFHFAALNGKIEAMQWLYDKEPTFIDKVCNNGVTPFHDAAANGSIEAMEWLYTKKFDFITIFTFNGCTPLHYAAQNNKVEAMKWLVERAQSLLQNIKDTGATPLHDAVEKGCFEATQWLVEKDPTLLQKKMNDRLGRSLMTPYDIVKNKNQDKIAKWLIARKKQESKKDDCPIL